MRPTDLPIWELCIYGCFMKVKSQQISQMARQSPEDWRNESAHYNISPLKTHTHSAQISKYCFSGTLKIYYHKRWHIWPLQASNCLGPSGCQCRERETEREGIRNYYFGHSRLPCKVVGKIKSFLDDLKNKVFSGWPILSEKVQDE